jgi:molybdopterin-biosynthesis enzyme MoeA-like protein
MAFALIVIGDEILSGKRQDQHFAKLRELLMARGLELARVQYLADDRARLTRVLAESFDGEDIVFSCGGIGATPDDHTRQACAAALGRPLEFNPAAEALIARHMAEIGQPLTPERRRLGELPAGVELIPNPYNLIPGFSVADHHFLPGFPVMAWPMIEWVLETRYRPLFGLHQGIELAMRVAGLNEGTLTPLFDRIEVEFPGVRIFSLPRIDPAQRFKYEIEMGAKGARPQVEVAFAHLRTGVIELGGEILENKPG